MKFKTTLIAFLGLMVISALVFHACKEDESNTPPSCEITTPSDSEEYMQGEIITISVTAFDSDGDIDKVLFVIDDVSKGSVSSSPYNYEWNTAGESLGNHTLKATSTDDEGGSTSDQVTIEIIEGVIAPVPAFTATPTSGAAPLTVNFTDQSTNSPESWSWDFGDGNTSTEQNPSNTYSASGKYSVSLTVTNVSGSDTETKDEFITVNIVAADFSADITGGMAPLSVSFSDETGNNPTSWLWDFGDGSSSTEQTPSHTYTNMGLYDVSLTVTNEQGSDTEIKEEFITVNGGDARSLIDARDEQSYKIILIGDQVWLAENMNYESSDSWFYDNDPANGDIYGRLYNWEAAVSVCPAGWHLASDEEWKILEGTVDSQFPVGDPEWDGTSSRGSDAGLNLRSSTGWDGTDAYGFNGLPGGGYYGDEGFDFIEENGIFWTGTEKDFNSVTAFSRVLYTNKVSRGLVTKEIGYSVRCVTD